MTIKIMQTCNACDASRELVLGVYGTHEELHTAARNSGWRDVQADKHLCAKCIRDIVGAPDHPPRREETA